MSVNNESQPIGFNKFFNTIRKSTNHDPDYRGWLNVRDTKVKKEHIKTPDFWEYLEPDKQPLDNED